MSKRLYLLVSALLLLGACNDTPLEVPQGASSPIAEHRVKHGASGVTVMTQNLYVGADVDLVIGALRTDDPSDDLPALHFAIETLGKTDFPARAAAIADEIARTRPHAVGLQEVSLINIDLGGFNGPTVHLDFMAILQAALARRGLHYPVAVGVQNVDVKLLGGLVSLVDRDALLVDEDRVRVTAASGQNFATNVGPIPGTPVSLIRGWVWARVRIDGAPYTIASLHAEADLGGEQLGLLRAAQLTEVVATLAGDERVIIVGDFNDAEGSPMYQVVTGAGFADVWREMRPGTLGLTCCHPADLSNQTAGFSQRIDYVFARGLGSGPHGTLFGKIDRFGEVPSDRVAGPAHPIWPADHVGLVASLRQ